MLLVLEGVVHVDVAVVGQQRAHLVRMRVRVRVRVRVRLRATVRVTVRVRVTVTVSIVRVGGEC